MRVGSARVGTLGVCCAACSCCGGEPPPPTDCEEFGVRDTDGEVILDANGECLLDLGKFA